MSAYTLTRCRDCGHEERRYSNVKRCRVCRGPLERPTVAEQSAARLRLAGQIVERARLWSAHDPVLQALLREWEAL
jgi:hypothetical protein